MNDRSPAGKVLAPWKILIADDDQDVHLATRMALRGLNFRGRGLEFIDAYSGAETLARLQANPDTAIVFLDVIMETEDAGLAAARQIRDCGLSLVRIIIRTGFPGQAPERQVIVDYDIHDYKEKTGLSVQTLFTVVISALRAYADLVALESHRRGLMRVLESVSWFDFHAVQRYIAGMLAEFSDLARLEAERIIMLSRPTAENTAMPRVIASLGDWQDTQEPIGMELLPQETAALIGDSLQRMEALCGAGGRTLVARNHGIDLLVFAAGDRAFAEADTVLLEVFLGKVCQALSNQQAFAEMTSVRDALLYGVALRANRWNTNAAVELQRLSRLVSAIALRLNVTLIFPGQIDPGFLRDIGSAALLHDLGNDTVSPALLGKCGNLDADERRLMQGHVGAGVEALQLFAGDRVNSGMLDLAGSILSGHHEHVDGSGYPSGHQGDAIPLAARLVAVADAFVAMTSPRPHRPALSVAAACAEIKAQADRRYDPRIVEAFMDVIERGDSKQWALS